MRWGQDKSGRFVKRPIYTYAELDRMAERRIVAFLRQRYGRVSYPISTNDLTVLVERFVTDLDQYYEFDSPEIEGKTEFVPGQKPRVKIARTLTEDPCRENRRRSTIAHELGHVILHKKLYDRGYQLDSQTSSCAQANGSMLSLDWMEWQAAYLSGALLIPARALDRRLRAFRNFDPLADALKIGTPEAMEFTDSIARDFQTSLAFASFRLERLGILYAPLTPAELAAIAKTAQARTNGLVHCSQLLPLIAAPVGLRVKVNEI